MRKILLLLAMFMGFSFLAFSQTRTVTGTVTTETGDPIANASIVVAGTSTGTVSSANGSFSLSVPVNRNVLIVSAVEMQPVEISIDRRSSLAVKMVASNPAAMDEVVVVAYGVQKRSDLTSSISSINAKNIEKRALSNVAGVLEGASPGVMVNNTYGQPGSTPNIRIRGFTSVNGSNAPLYVVDGVIFNGSVADLNPNDVETVSILKDGAATALYGNRASNGVVLITTKKAVKGTTTLNFIANQGAYTRGLKEYETVSQNDYMELMWLGYRNNLLSTLSTTYPTVESANAQTNKTLIPNLLKTNIYNLPSDALFDANGKLLSNASIRPGYIGDFDWYEPILQNGHRQDYNVTGGAGTDKSNLFFSTGYLDEKGFLQRSRYQRFTGRLNGELNPVKWLKTGLNLNGSHQISNIYDISSSSTSFVNPIYNARNIAPIYPVHLHDPETGEYVLDASGKKQYDPGDKTRNQYVGRHAIWENELNKDITYLNTLQGQAYMNVTFLKDFIFTLRGDINLRNSENKRYDNGIIGDGSGNNGRTFRTLYRYKFYTFQQQLNWIRSFDKHSLTAFVGHENYSYNRDYTYASKNSQTFPDVIDLINFPNFVALTGYEDNYRTESYLSRAAYNYAQKYYLEGSFRRDGSSRFAADNRWGNFWSASGAWVISRESFFRVPAVNNLKLRASYGELGNDQSAGWYAYKALYAISQNNNLAAVYKSQNAADSIVWEATTASNIALEGTLFKRLNFTAEYFEKRSRDLIFDVYLPLSAGATSTSSAEATSTKNLGTTSNKGWEFSLDYDLIRKEDMRWNIGANVTFLKSKVIRLPEQNRTNGIISGSKKILEGHSIYDYWLYQYAGVDMLNGNALYIADDVVYNGGLSGGSDDKRSVIPAQWLTQINGKYYVTNPTYAKRDYSGSAIPTAFGGVNTTFEYKGFALSALFTYSFGAKILDYNYQSLMTMSGSVSNLHKDLLNAWKEAPAGMTADSPDRINPNATPVIDYSKSQYTNATSTRFLQDGKYMVVKNIALSYRLPSNVINKASLRSCLFILTLENLATYTTLQGMDPQQSFDGTTGNYFMTPRVVSFGVNIGF